MKSFFVGLMAGALGAHVLMDNKNKVLKKGKQAIKDKIEEILD